MREVLTCQHCYAKIVADRYNDKDKSWTYVSRVGNSKYCIPGVVHKPLPDITGGKNVKVDG